MLDGNSALPPPLLLLLLLFSRSFVPRKNTQVVF
jgi:hypothetical protein